MVNDGCVGHARKSVVFSPSGNPSRKNKKQIKKYISLVRSHAPAAASQFSRWAGRRRSTFQSKSPPSCSLIGLSDSKIKVLSRRCCSIYSFNIRPFRFPFHGWWRARKFKNQEGKKTMCKKQNHTAAEAINFDKYLHFCDRARAGGSQRGPSIAGYNLDIDVWCVSACVETVVWVNQLWICDNWKQLFWCSTKKRKRTSACWNSPRCTALCLQYIQIELLSSFDRSSVHEKASEGSCC